MTHTEIMLRELSTGTEYLVKVNGALTLYELNVEFNRQHNRSVEILFYSKFRPLEKNSQVYLLFSMQELRITIIEAYIATWTSAMIKAAIEVDPYVLVHVAHFIELLNPQWLTPPNVISAYIKKRLSEDDFELPVMYTSEFQDPVTNNHI